MMKLVLQMNVPVLFAFSISEREVFSSWSCFSATSMLHANFVSPHRPSFIRFSLPKDFTVKVLSAVPRLRVCGVGSLPLPAPLIVIVGEREEGVVLSLKGNVAVRVGTRNPLANKRPFWPFWGTGRCCLPKVAGGRGVRVLGCFVVKRCGGVGFVGKRGCGE